MTPAEGLARAIAAKQRIAAERRQTALRYHQHGHQPKAIAVLLGVSAGQVRRYLREAGMPAAGNPFPLTNVRVWRMYQARCLFCDWSGDIFGYADRHLAEDQKRAHVAEHRRG